MKKSNIILIIVIVAILLIAITLISSYNSMVSKQELVDTAFSNLDIMLKRRADSIPNLVNTVKGYSNHESEIIEKVTTARQNLLNASSVEDKASADNELTSSLNALMVVVENYPDLKASTNFSQLADELVGAENRIATARRDYNEAVKQYNLTIKKFPNNLMAGMFNFESAVYFEADETSREVPNVNFE